MLSTGVSRPALEQEQAEFIHKLNLNDKRMNRLHLHIRVAEAASAKTTEAASRGIKSSPESLFRSVRKLDDYYSELGQLQHESMSIGEALRACLAKMQAIDDWCLMARHRRSQLELGRVSGVVFHTGQSLSAQAAQTACPAVSPRLGSLASQKTRTHSTDASVAKPDLWRKEAESPKNEPDHIKTAWTGSPNSRGQSFEPHRSPSALSSASYSPNAQAVSESEQSQAIEGQHLSHTINEASGTNRRTSRNESYFEDSDKDETGSSERHMFGHGLSAPIRQRLLRRSWIAWHFHVVQQGLRATG